MPPPTPPVQPTEWALRVEQSMPPAVGAVGIASASALTVTQGARLAMFLKIADCSAVSQEEAGDCSYSNPLCLSIHSTSLPGTLGGLVSCMIISPGLISTHLILCVSFFAGFGGSARMPVRGVVDGAAPVKGRMQALTWLDAQEKARFPSFSFWPMLLVFQTTLDHGATLTLYSGDSGVIAGIGAICLSISILFLIVRRTWRLPAETVPEEGPSKAWQRFTFGTVVWDSRKFGDRTFVNRWALVFKDYVHKRRWFLSVEIVLMQALALLNAWRPRETGLCATRSALVCAALLLYLIVLAVLRPFLAPIDQWHVAIVTLLQVLGLACVVHALSVQPSYSERIMDASGVLLLASSCLVVVKALFDVGVWVYERWKERAEGTLPRRRWVLDNRRRPPSSPLASQGSLQGSVLDTPTVARPALRRAPSVLDPDATMVSQPRGRGTSVRFDSSVTLPALSARSQRRLVQQPSSPLARRTRASTAEPGRRSEVAESGRVRPRPPRRDLAADELAESGRGRRRDLAADARRDLDAKSRRDELEPGRGRPPRRNHTVDELLESGRTKPGRGYSADALLD